MGDDSTGPPLKRRVPGAARVGSAPSARPVLPDALIARMQAAVDAAHQAQGMAQAAADAEPVTEPLPISRDAVAARDWATAESSNGTGPRGDAWSFRLGADLLRGPDEPDLTEALDDLAESYLHADPDLTAGYADDVDLDAAAPAAQLGIRRWDAFSSAAPSGPAQSTTVEPGADVKAERAAWWDHAVESGRTARATRPSKARQRWRPDTTPLAGTTAPSGIKAPSVPVPKLDSTSKPERPVKPPRATSTEQLDPPEPLTAAPASPRRRRRSAMAGVGALAIVLIAGGIVALVLSSRDSGGKMVPSSDSKAAKDRAAVRRAVDIASAATWVTAQVNRTAVVACDPATCQALAQHGFPAGKLVRLEPTASFPMKSTIVVDTPTLAHQFGTSLASNWAPAVLAGFGHGADRITVRVTATRGARAYISALRSDRKERQAVGSGLLTSRQIAVTPAARSAMAAGDVDARLLIVITALASQHPIDILAFGRTWSGTTIGIPLRTAYFAASDPASYLSAATYSQAMITLLRAQPAAYRPVHITTVHLGGQRVLRVEYPAPSPVGLISPNQ